MKIKLLIGILVSIALYSFSQPFVQNYKMPFERPKNVIILIGNGMGLSDITGGLYTNGKSLNLESCEIVGFIKQNSSNNLIPDAASSTTAIVTGEKVKNGWLGLDSKGHPIQNIFEMAKEKKMSTGIITNGSIFGQAPAAFVAHTKSSDDKPAILNAYLSAEVDFLVGAGMNDFNEFIKLGDHIKTWESLNYLKEDFSMIELGKTSIDVQKNYLYFL
ncbi:MAG: alkaline phosphatase, partial [Bacteroidota bacterium]